MLKLARLDDRAVIAVTGAEARPFLHNLLTQNVETLGEGEVRYGALLTAQGRLLYDMFLVGTPDGVLLDVAADARATLLPRLKLYKLRAKVDIAPTDQVVWALWGEQAAAGSAAPGGYPDPRTPALGWRVVADQGAAPFSSVDSAAVATVDDYDLHRLQVGAPDPLRDGLSDRAYPIEADLDLLGAIDFHKGCFIGQETTSRMKRRGTIKTRLLPLTAPGAEAGAEVLAGSLRAGEITYARGDRALALLRLDRIVGTDLTVNGRPAQVDRPTWFPDLAPAGAVEAAAGSLS